MWYVQEPMVIHAFWETAYGLKGLKRESREERVFFSLVNQLSKQNMPSTFMPTILGKGLCIKTTNWATKWQVHQQQLDNPIKLSTKFNWRE